MKSLATQGARDRQTDVLRLSRGANGKKVEMTSLI